MDTSGYQADKRMSRLDRYQNPELYELLCGEYVLGTMTGRVRRRFERLIDDRPYLQEAVSVWEQRLYPYSKNIPPQIPHHRVWKNIKREIVDSYNFRPQENRVKGLWRKLFVWRSIALSALSLCIVLFVQQYFLPQNNMPLMPSYIAVLETGDKSPMFVATASRQASNLVIKRMDKAGMSKTNDLELWCYMKQSDKPWSMGVLARKEETVLPLTEHDWKMMAETRSLAISIEPMGGSPTGKPTGPVMYEGSVVSLI